MSRLARLSLANRGLVALVAVIVTRCSGCSPIPNLKQQLFPSLDFPAAFVVASYPGAAPEIVERQVTEPIENSVQGVDGLEKVTSTSREGVATIQLEFTFGTDLDDAVARLQTVAQPDRRPAARPGSIRRSSPAAPTTSRCVVLAASSAEDESAFADKLRRIVLPEIPAVDGVREATVTGARDPRGRDHPEPGQGRRRRRRRHRAHDRAARQRRRGAGRHPDRGRARRSRSRSAPPLTTVDDLREHLPRPRRPVAAAPVRLGDVADRRVAARPRRPPSPAPTASPASASR